MTNKYFIPIALILLFTMLLFGCSGKSKDYLYSNETQLSSETDCYYKYKSTSHSDGPDYSCNIKHFSGMETIWRYDAPADTTLTGSCDFLVLKGQVKLVLITPDDEVVTLVEQSNNSELQGLSTIKLPVKKGENRLKLVAKKKAEVSVTLDLSDGQAE